MKHQSTISVLTISLLITGGSLLIADNNPQTSTDSLIEQLGNEEFSEREAAMKLLWQQGRDALPHLQKAETSTNPEIAARARLLLRNIEAGVLPETPKEIADLIARYNKSKNYAGKLDALEELRDIKAFQQIIHALSWEKDTALRDRLFQRLQSVGLQAARQSLAKGDTEQAIKLLNLCPPNTYNLKAAAHIYQHTGGIDAAITRSHAQPNDGRNNLWMLTLLQAKNDKNALKNFKALGDVIDTGATAKLLDGDPESAIAGLALFNKDRAHQERVHILKRSYSPKDEKKTRAALKKQIAKAKLSNDKTTKEAVLRLLLLCGETDLAESFMLNNTPDSALDYFQSLEMSQEELEIYKAPDPKLDKAVFNNWVATTIKKEMADNGALLDKQESTLEALAQFYYMRGEVALAKSIYTPLLKALQEEGFDRWFHIVSSMPESGMHDLALEFALAQHQEDNDLENLMHAFYGDTIEVDHVWEALRKRSPEIKQRFLAMAMLMNLDTENYDRGQKIEAALLQDARKKGLKAKNHMLTALAFLAEQRNDLFSALRYYKELAQNPEAAPSSHCVDKYQEMTLAVMDWPELIKAYDLNPKRLKENPLDLAIYAIAKRKTGKEAEGLKLLEDAILITLALPNELNDIASHLHQYGFQREAAKVWEETLLNYLPSDWEFAYTLILYNAYAAPYIETADWKRAASLHKAECFVKLANTGSQVSPVSILRSRFNSEFTRGMKLLKNNQRSAGVATLDSAHSMMQSDGLLANHFYPSLINANVNKEFDAWFEKSWSSLSKEIATFPQAHNTRNTAAWLGSRSLKRLDESLEHAKLATTQQANQPAYLDTMAEVYFAKGDRKSALAWSQQALNSVANGSLAYSRTPEQVTNMYWDLTHQHSRFASQPLPAAKGQH